MKTISFFKYFHNPKDLTITNKNNNNKILMFAFHKFIKHSMVA